jgi:acyl-coenzyme A synthetase/AMP-(fatty) acid ligase
MILYIRARPEGRREYAYHEECLADTRNLTNECASARRIVVVAYVRELRQLGSNDYGSLLNGASVYPYDAKKKGFGQLSSWLLSNEITILRSVPTTFRHFMSTVPENQRFPAVRVLSVGGEPMFRADLDYFNRHFVSPCVLVHALGPTECLTVCWSCIPHGTRIADSKLPIGYPLKDKDVLVLDEGGRELGEGEVGEIAVKVAIFRQDTGAILSVQNPYSCLIRWEATSIYLTGDLGLRLRGAVWSISAGGFPGENPRVSR